MADDPSDGAPPSQRPPTPGYPHRPSQQPSHPTGRAALLMIGVVVLIIVVAALDAFAG